MEVLLAKESDDTLIVPFFKGTMPAIARGLDKAMDGLLTKAVKENPEGITPFYTLPKVLLVNLGEQKKFSRDKLRKTAGSVVKYCKTQHINSFAVLYDFKKKDVRDFTEGLLMGDYVFDDYKTKKDEDKKKSIKRVTLLVKDLKSARRELDIGLALASGNLFARDLVNKPVSIADAAYMAKKARELAKMPNVSCKVLGDSELKKEKLNLILAVNQAAHEEAKLVVLHYKKGGAKKPAVFVGKGVCFDAGGTNLKPSGYIEDMKEDMAGAAACLGLVKAVAMLKLNVNIMVVCPLVQNLLGGKAIKPSDIIKTASGKTVEIANTDAEGRLVLADALHYSLRFKPEKIVNIATLTGAVMVALGDKAAAIMGTDKKLVDDLVSAGALVHERLWQLPLWEDYDDDVKSKVADIKNLGKEREAGVIAGGAFLKAFVEGAKWAHIDIGWTAYTKEGKGYMSYGATGFGTRLFVEYLMKGK
ncbi:MAG: M17 family metallopeptidase [Candidatus Nanoarchaeia archaeon]